MIKHRPEKLWKTKKIHQRVRQFWFFSLHLKTRKECGVWKVGLFLGQRLVPPGFRSQSGICVRTKTGRQNTFETKRNEIGKREKWEEWEGRQLIERRSSSCCALVIWDVLVNLLVACSVCSNQLPACEWWRVLLRYWIFIHSSERPVMEYKGTLRGFCSRSTMKKGSKTGKKENRMESDTTRWICYDVERVTCRSHSDGENLISWKGGNVGGRDGKSKDYVWSNDPCAFRILDSSLMTTESRSRNHAVDHFVRAYKFKNLFRVQTNCESKTPTNQTPACPFHDRKHGWLLT